MLALHPLPGDGRFYCGPAAIASITGLHPKQEIREAINKLRGRKPTQGVIGMWPHEVKSVLESFGFTVYSFNYPKEKRRTVKDYLAHYPDFAGVLEINHHFIAASGNMCQDNKSGCIYPVERFAGNRAKVKSALRVVRL